MRIDWNKQHCGVHRASLNDLLINMPDLNQLIKTFPENPNDFIWDVKVHMLMPGQFPCIPNWHYDNVPRVNNAQDFNLVKQNKPMWLWISNEPLTEFREIGFVKAQTWTRFTQCDEHRGTISKNFCWRAFIRATHKEILLMNNSGKSCLRRHSQVYIDSANFKW